MKKLLVLAVLSLVLVATPAMAREGFYAGALVLFNEFSGDAGEGVDTGNGLGLRGGFGFNRYFSVEVGIFKTTHDVTGGESADFTGMTADAKLSLPLTGSNMEPYFLLGLGKYTFDLAGTSTDGTGTRYGIGVDMYLFPELSFNVGLTRTNIDFDGTKGDVNTLDFGIAYHFL